MAALLGAASEVSAQAWLIVPTVTAQLTYSDNVFLAPTELARGDTFAEITPGVRISHQGPRLSLDLDYRLRALRYVDESEANEQQNWLNAFATLEAVERWLFVDARARIEQEAISAFGPRLAGAAGNSRNQRETTDYVVSPFVRGALGANADYELRFAAYDSRASSEAVAGGAATVEEDRYRLYSGIGTLRGTTGISGLGWSADASAHSVRYPDGGRTVDWQLARAFAVYEVVPQFRLRAAIGRESNTIESDDAESSNLYAYGFDWSPSERTRLNVLGERRFFGNGHAIGFTHRESRLAFSYSDVKEVTTDVGDQLGGGIETALDLITAALTAQIPDPQQRQEEARRLLRQARIAPEFGRPPQAGTTRVLLERRRNFGVTWFSPRDTVALSLYRTDRESIGGGNETLDDFALSNDISDRGFSGNWGHRLTPLSTLNLVGEWIRSTGSGDVPLESEDMSLTLSLATRFGVQTSGALGYTYRRFDDVAANSARENSVFVSVTHQF